MSIVSHICDRCGREFKQKGHLTNHRRRKVPCPIIQKTTQLSAIDLFCGCGGMSNGLVNSGINVLAGIDVWDKAMKKMEVCLANYSKCDFSDKSNYLINYEDFKAILD